MNSFNSLPEIKVISLTASSQENSAPTQFRRGRSAKVPTTLTDIRWLKIEEFLNSKRSCP